MDKHHRTDHLKPLLEFDIFYPARNETLSSRRSDFLGRVSDITRVCTMQTQSFFWEITCPRCIDPDESSRRAGAKNDTQRPLHIDPCYLRKKQSDSADFLPGPSALRFHVRSPRKKLVSAKSDSIREKSWFWDYFRDKSLKSDYFFCFFGAALTG